MNLQHLQSAPPASQQIAAHFRRAIRAGELPPNHRLPTQRELAAQLGVSGSTIHLAVQELLAQGLVVNRGVRGVFVAATRPGLRQVGIYYSGDALACPGHDYLRAVHAALLGGCHHRELTATIFHDPRPESESGTVTDELAAAVSARQLDAVIVPAVGLPGLHKLGKLDLPVAYHCSASIANSVGFDLSQFIDLALGEMRAAGCRTVGLISPLATQIRRQVVPGVHDHVAFIRRFIDRAGDLGLAIRDGWIRATEGEDDLRNRNHEEYGYEQARALLAQDELPQGLIVIDDVVARGVITALLAARKRGAKMTLVLHKNAEVPLICPLPARFIVSSAVDVARELLAMVERQFNGQAPGGPVRVPFRVTPS